MIYGKDFTIHELKLAAKMNAKTKPKTKTCALLSCEKPFVPHSHRQKYCSISCQRKANVKLVGRLSLKKLQGQQHAFGVLPPKLWRNLSKC